MEKRQLDTLAKLGEALGCNEVYLAGGTAVAFHLAHRVSRDLDLFSVDANADLEHMRQKLAAAFHPFEVVAGSAVSMRLLLAGELVDVVRYPYPLLEAPIAGPRSFPVAGLKDLAVMKLAAIAKRGIRRDFWDLHEILQRSTLTLDDALSAYVQRYGTKEPDLYHVMRSLTYFTDAERDVILPMGMKADRWEEIKRFMREAARGVLRHRTS